MTWTTPATWTTNQVVSASDLNAQVRDNMTYLLSGRTLGTKIGTSTATTTSATFVDIDATNYIITSTLTSGRCVVWVVLPIVNASVATVTLDIIVDSTTRSSGGGTSGNGLVQYAHPNAHNYIVSFFGEFTGLSAGSHTFKPQWRVSAGTESTAGNGHMILLEY